MFYENLNFILPLLPEAFLTLCTFVALSAGVFSRVDLKKRNVNLSVWAGMAGAFVLSGLAYGNGETFLTADGLFGSDGYTSFVKTVVYALSAVAMAFGAQWLKWKKYARFEYPVLMAFSVAGTGVALSSEDFLPMFLGMEAAGMPLCFLTAYKRFGDRSTEAGAKFALVSLSGSAFLLFGISVLYVCTGTTDFARIKATAESLDFASVLPALVFITAGFMIKAGAVPFHSWVPSVYEGMPTPVTAYAAFVMRFVVWSVFAKAVFYPLAFAQAFWRPVFLITAAAGVFVGAFGSVTQTNVKRLAAYTLIVSNGFILMSFGMAEPVSFLFFALIDAVLAAGMFAVILSMRTAGVLSEKIDTLAGQGKAKPVRSALYALIFLGMTGIPPFAGFWRRFFLFEAAVKKGDFWPCLFMMAGSFVLAYAYLKIIRSMYAGRAKAELSAVPLFLKLTLWVTAGVSLFLSFPVASVQQAVQQAVLFTGG